MDRDQGPMPDVPTDLHGTGSGDESDTSQVRQEAAARNEGHPIAHVSKKTRGARRKTKTETKRHGTTGRTWTWGYLNTFQPIRKWTREGRLSRPISRKTIPGCIYYAIKRIKRGTDKKVYDAAIHDGLEALTIQPLYRRVQIELRLLARFGVIKRTKHLKDDRRRT